VARDRKRAKQRRDRGRAASVRRDARRDAAAGQRPSVPADDAPANGGIERADVPGALDHASAEVDEFDAALIAGAEGIPATPEVQAEAEAEERLTEEPGSVEADIHHLAEGEIEAEAEAEGDLSADELQEPAGAGVAHATPEQASGAPVRSGNRAIGFLRASWAELQRVQWPDRRQVSQATAVVVGFVAIAGAYLGLADYVAKEIVNFIL
jgi:preprotein translocase subunit SecE